MECFCVCVLITFPPPNFPFHFSRLAYKRGAYLFHPLHHPTHQLPPFLRFFDSDSLLDFLEENRAFVHTQINHHYHHHQQQQQQQQRHTEEGRGKGREERDYWLGTAAVLAQFEGMRFLLLGVGDPIAVLPSLTPT